MQKSRQLGETEVSARNPEKYPYADIHCTIGDSPEDPVFCVTDLLIHLSKSADAEEDGGSCYW